MTLRFRITEWSIVITAYGKPTRYCPVVGQSSRVYRTRINSISKKAASTLSILDDALPDSTRVGGQQRCYRMKLRLSRSNLSAESMLSGTIVNAGGNADCMCA